LIYALAEGANAVTGQREVPADGGRDGYEFFGNAHQINDDDQYMKSVVCARHETVNKRFKQWGLSHRFSTASPPRTFLLPFCT
jgi:hypothetical protein